MTEEGRSRSKKSQTLSMTEEKSFTEEADSLGSQKSQLSG
jgi:hypothetical protein